MSEILWRVLGEEKGDFDIKIKVLEDGTMDIEWDETHPIAIENGMNFWTPEQWVKMFEAYLETYPEPEG